MKTLNYFAAQTTEMKMKERIFLNVKIVNRVQINYSKTKIYLFCKIVQNKTVKDKRFPTTDDTVPNKTGPSNLTRVTQQIN